MVTDFHLHTTRSDGLLDPLALVEAVARVGVQRFAITDHDAVGAYTPEVLARVRELGMDLVTGIEMDVVDGPIELHLLGFGFDLGNAPLRAHLATVQAQRRRRGEDQLRVVQRVLGPDSITPEEAVPAHVDTVMKPHIIKALLSRKLFPDYKTAKKWLKENVPDDVELTKPTVAEGIRMLHEAGGTAVLAHPAYYCKDHGLDPVAYLEKLAALGLDGVEAAYPYARRDPALFTPEAQQALFETVSACAARLGLQTTRGSDSHSQDDVDRMYGDGPDW